MGKGMRFRESPATPEENSFDYRVEWEDRLSSTEEAFANFKAEGKFNIKHYGPGSRSFTDLDNAWDTFCRLKECIDFIGVKLFQRDKDGNEWRRN